MEGTDEEPSWNINGADHYPTELPPNYFFDNTAGKLEVEVTENDNRSVLYCFHQLTPSCVVKSDKACLIIQEGIYGQFAAYIIK